MNVSQGSSRLGAGGAGPKEIFEGFQQDSGWFFSLSEKKNVSTKVRVSRLDGRIDIVGGIDSKISKRVFRIEEVLQCVYHNAECQAEGQVINLDSSIKYNFNFVFKDRNVEPQEIKFSKNAMKALSSCLNQVKKTSLADG